jgi:hypothetical protein
MRFESRGAIWTDDAKVLDPIVIANAVHVVEDEAHPLPSPDLTLTT